MQLNRQLKAYAKGDIAARLLETALKLYFDGGDGFAVIHLAANSEELLAGMIKKQRESGTDLPASLSEQTAREKSIRAIGAIREIHGSPKKLSKRLAITSTGFVTRRSTTVTLIMTKFG